MTETEIAALIGVGGAVLVAITSTIAQVRITRAVIAADLAKLTKQLRGELENTRREKREDKLVDALSGLLFASDPESPNGGDYARAVELIHRAQLLLMPTIPAHTPLNSAISRLGKDLRAYKAPDQRNDSTAALAALYAAQSDVIETARTVIHTTTSPV